ncbi:MAG: hypothetical protein KAS38_18145 [Anaerolineales bacterium]|nr:hypothetical protein [Anaerolineales bacterium]
MKSTLWYLVLFSLLTLVISGCSNNQNSAPASIEEYINALVNKYENTLIIYSCADWESEAKSEFNSFSAVSVSLEDLTCQETGQDGDYTIVSCEGIIIANYGNEVLEINLADQNYLSIYEGGEWRMCGYH